LSLGGAVLAGGDACEPGEDLAEVAGVAEAAALGGLVDGHAVVAEQGLGPFDAQTREVLGEGFAAALLEEARDVVGVELEALGHRLEVNGGCVVIIQVRNYALEMALRGRLRNDADIQQLLARLVNEGVGGQAISRFRVLCLAQRDQTLKQVVEDAAEYACPSRS